MAAIPETQRRRSMSEIERLVLSEASMEEVLQSCLEVITELFGAHHGFIFWGEDPPEPGKDWQLIEAISAHPSKTLIHPAADALLPAKLHLHMQRGRCLTDVVMSSISDESASFSLGLQHFACLPISDANRVYAVVWVFKNQPISPDVLDEALRPLLSASLCALRTIRARSIKARPEPPARLVPPLVEGQVSVAQVQHLLDYMFNAVLLIGDQDLISRHNYAAAALLGAGKKNLVGRALGDFLPDFKGRDDLGFWRSVSARTGDGQKVMLDVAAFQIKLEGQNYKGFVLDDISDRIRSAREYQHSLQRFEVLTDLAPAGILQLNGDWECIYANHTWCDYSEMTEQDTAGLGWIQAIDDADARPALDRMRKALAKTGKYDDEFRLRTPLGRCLWVKANACALYDEHGEITGVIMTVSDITEERRTQRRLRDIAERDQLTGLVNRTFFNDRLEAALLGVGRYGSVALFFLDLDEFKIINDTLGHDAGDELLSAMANRLREAVRDVDTIARLGGDEFTIILTHIQSIGAVTIVANKIIDAMAKPFLLANKPIYVTASIGIAVADEPGVKSKLLLKQADLALYDAKAGGRNQYKFHSPALDEDANINICLRQSLKELGGKDFRLVFQPQVNARTGELVGLECLTRWKHANVGEIKADIFIKMIEDSGLINVFSAWLLEEVFSTLETWLRSDPKWGLPLSINLSAKQFRDKTLSKIIIGRCHAHGLPTGLIRFEVTESAFMEDRKIAAGILGDLSKAGFKIALDDFGKGYSSLVYLRDMPLDTIKIDRSFVEDVLIDKSDADIVRAVISLSKTLGMGLVAEGVSDAKVVDWLCEHGCEIQQGFHFAKPLERADLEETLLGDSNRSNVHFFRPRDET